MSTTFNINGYSAPDERVSLAEYGFGLLICRRPEFLPIFSRIVGYRLTYVIDGAAIWPIICHDWPGQPVTFLRGCENQIEQWLGPALISPAGNVAVAPWLFWNRSNGLADQIAAMEPTALRADQFNELMAVLVGKAVPNG